MINVVSMIVWEYMAFCFPENDDNVNFLVLVGIPEVSMSFLIVDDVCKSSQNATCIVHGRRGLNVCVCGGGGGGTQCCKAC